ncbi:hypothetical protein E6W39_28275 [Kitasatospora acidiphila]|uniref:Spore-associated protein A n=1 Tax=Kitasatospora acidiphila TaxID=2567942 RepID=A0A540W8S4_9ACTN|nr:hypothetical protein [Kitasatospora acidiphila]TQF05420.1 hypothetical protein E6W39_28275 [Kitasatospora acidiphila]
MRSFMRKFAVAGALALAAGGVTVASAGSASASGWGCSGSEVASYNVVSGGGGTWSTVHLFWDSSTGYNCAVNVKASGLYGVQTITSVTIKECGGDTPSTCSNIVDTQDNTNEFYYYAGPVKVNGQGHCIELSAYTENTLGEAASYSSNGGFHC